LELQRTGYGLPSLAIEPKFETFNHATLSGKKGVIRHPSTGAI
jgi:hypothetical protein